MLLQVLSCEKSNRPEAWGGSVFGYDDVHLHLAKVLPQWRPAGPSSRCRTRRWVLGMIVHLH